jgi:hypothetical protein
MKAGVRPPLASDVLLANLETHRVVGSPGSVADRLRCALA